MVLVQDRNYTNIRYIKKLQLRSIAGPLQPLVTGEDCRVFAAGKSRGCPARTKEEVHTRAAADQHLPVCVGGACF